jgi:hypothetical protein
VHQHASIVNSLFVSGVLTHAVTGKLTYLAVPGGQGLTESPHNVSYVGNDVLQGWEDVFQLLLERCCIVHIGSPGSKLLALQQQSHIGMSACMTYPTECCCSAIQH